MIPGKNIGATIDTQSVTLMVLLSCVHYPYELLETRAQVYRTKKSSFFFSAVD